jgi:hypothetical protein
MRLVLCGATVQVADPIHMSVGMVLTVRCHWNARNSNWRAQGEATSDGQVIPGREQGVGNYPGRDAPQGAGRGGGGPPGAGWGGGGGMQSPGGAGRGGGFPGPPGPGQPWH